MVGTVVAVAQGRRGGQEEEVKVEGGREGGTERMVRGKSEKRERRGRRDRIVG
jgi:hypothetical protein